MLWADVPDSTLPVDAPATDGTASVTWPGMDATDRSANAYIYRAVEGQLAGEAFTPGAPAGYTLAGQGSLALINTYIIPKADVTATKTWVGGASPKPVIWFKLQRTLGEVTEDVPDVDPKELLAGTTSVT